MDWQQLLMDTLAKWCDMPRLSTHRVRIAAAAASVNFRPAIIP
jgi:hypothetical protein